jgi:glycosyltransferase involved in cell wall biosynthesis
LSERKNIGGLLEAYRRVLARRPDGLELIVAGAAGADAGPWLDQLSRPPFAERARHLGYVAPERLRDLYAGAAVFVLPSFEEGFGMTALEAMASGVPLVASNRGALPEVVGDAGLLVAPTEPDMLADAILRILSDEPLARGLAERGRRRAREFTWSRCARALRGAYEAAIEHRQRR